MLQTLLKILVTTIGGIAVHNIIKSKEIKPMNNCHLQFLDFETIISLDANRKEKLRRSRKAIENKLRRYFKNNFYGLTPRFYTQGSIKMNTTIIKQDMTYDVDLGVYFLNDPNVQSTTVQNYIYKALFDHTSRPPQRRNKCIRIIYIGEFNIDIPVYKLTNNMSHPMLAAKSGWEKSDPKELCDWFNEKVKLNGYQIRRLVKYFKAWADYQNRKMPSGIAFTVWVAKHYVRRDRDDLSFYETAKAIKRSFGIFSVECPNPATPNDDLLNKLNDQQIDNFQDEFNHLIKQCEAALLEKNEENACKVWRQVFGYSFPTI